MAPPYAKMVVPNARKTCVKEIGFVWISDSFTGSCNIREMMIRMQYMTEEPAEKTPVNLQQKCNLYVL